MGSLEIVEAEPEVLEPGEQTLTELADTINREYHLGMEDAGEAVAHWVCAGRALTTARNRCPANEWGEWAESNLRMSLPHANRLMRIARYQDVLVEHDGSVTSIKQANRLLRGLPEANPRKLARSVEIQEDARRLHRAGVPVREIAEVLGVHENTARKWVDPKFAERVRETNVRLLRQRRQAAKALEDREREQAIKGAVRKAGAAEQELYAMAERMQDIMGQAHREATEPEKRRHYALAGEHYRKMRDEIVRALGVA